MMDVMDTRIEGVEGVMSDLQKTVHKLQKKVRVALCSYIFCGQHAVSLANSGIKQRCLKIPIRRANVASPVQKFESLKGNLVRRDSDG